MGTQYPCRYSRHAGRRKSHELTVVGYGYRLQNSLRTLPDFRSDGRTRPWVLNIPAGTPDTLDAVKVMS